MKIKALLPSLFASLIFFSNSFSVDRTLDIANSGMDFFEQQNGVIMDDVANLMTPGFKEVRITPFFDPVTHQVTYTIGNNFAQGSFVNTGRLLDFAIESDGFFLFQGSNGGYFLSRDGRFEINSNRQLVSVSGKFLVMGVDRSPIVVEAFQELKTDDIGRLFTGDNTAIGQLEVVELPNYNKLRSVNNVFFELDSGSYANLKEPDRVSIKQGFYEGSNVEYSRLISKLSDTNKYTASTQVIQTRMKMLDSMIDIVNKN